MHNLTVMFTVKKAVKSVVEKDQQRILALSLAHDGKLIVKGDDQTVGNMDNTLNDALKHVLSEVQEDHGERLAYVES